MPSFVHRERFGPRRAGLVAGLACIAFGGCGETPPPPPPPPQAVEPPPPPPPPLSIRLEPIRPLVLKPGASGTAKVAIDRENVVGQLADAAGEAGILGAVTFTVGQVPDGVTVVANPVTGEGWRADVVATAAERLGDEELEADIPITATLQGVSAEGTLPIRVARFEPPSITLDGEPTLQPGMSGMVRVHVDRHGFGRPVAFVTGSVPDGISCALAADPELCDITAASISVTPTAGDGRSTITLSGSLMGRPVQANIVVDVRARPYDFGPVRGVTVAAGEKRVIDLPVARTVYAGPLDVTIDGLPDGVSAEPATVAAGASTARLVVRAAADAPARVGSARLHGVGGRFVVDQPLVIRVSDGATTLPDAVAGGPDARLVKPGSFGGRVVPAGKAAMQALFGGTEHQTAAIARGLAWLARRQQPDGGWSMGGASEAAGGTGPAATALALLPFLGEGVSHKRAPDQPRALSSYKSVVEKGLVFLGTRQAHDRGPGTGFFGGDTRAHALATIAFCEAFALSRDDRAKVHARPAVEYLVGLQEPGSGGWPPAPGKPADLVTTGWAVVALRTAQLAGVGAPKKQLAKAERFIAACGSDADGGAVTYGGQPGGAAASALTAVGLRARLWCGGFGHRAQLEAAVPASLAAPPMDPLDGMPPLDEALCAMEVLFHLEGEPFDAWHEVVRDRLLKTQDSSGDEAGSWGPREMAGGPAATRLESTALALLILETPSRHLPLFRDVKRESRGAESAAAEREAAD